MKEAKMKPATALRLLALHVTNVAATRGEGLSEAQRQLICRSASLLRSVANQLSPSLWNPRQRWDKWRAGRGR